MYDDPLAVLACADGLERIATPFVAIDLDRMETNIREMAGFLEPRRARLAPHFKHHKCSAIAALQREHGASTFTCATAHEAACLARAGVPRLLIANVVTDQVWLDAIASLSRDREVLVAVDSASSTNQLAGVCRSSGTEIGVLIEVDIGMGRCGVRTESEAVQLAAAIDKAGGLVFRGLQAYEGHTVDIVDRQARRQAAREALLTAGAVCDSLAASYGDLICTGGSTATYDVCAELPFMTDIQAGSYVLMDGAYETLVEEFRCAAVVVATVLTSRRSGELIVNAGAKAIGSDWGAARIAGADAEPPSVYSEEHSRFVVRDGRRPKVGERVAIVPPHSCTTMNLHPEAFGVRAGRLSEVIAVDGRR
jgi:D-serine deaminase-like pyridoxal phosphate-dependent protein